MGLCSQIEAHLSLGLGWGHVSQPHGERLVLDHLAVLVVERVDLLLDVAAARQVAVHIRGRHVHERLQLLDLQRQRRHLLCGLQLRAANCE